MSRDIHLFLKDIEESCRKIVCYSEGLTRDEVFRDELRFDAILFNLHVIGEAVKNLPRGLKDRYSDIAWREVSGLRDFVAHAYFALDLDILWDAIRRDVPALRDRIRQVIVSEEQGDEGNL